MRGSELDAVEMLASQPWKQFLAKDGMIESRKANGMEVHSLTGGLWIDVGEKIRIDMLSIDIQEKVELFRIHISEDENFEVRMKEPRYLPKPMPVAQAPIGLNLANFLDEHLRISIVRIAEEIFLEETNSCVAVVDSALLATTAKNDRLLLYQDYDDPWGPSITTSASFIDSVLIRADEIVIV